MNLTTEFLLTLEEIAGVLAGLNHSIPESTTPVKLIKSTPRTSSLVMELFELDHTLRSLKTRMDGEDLHAYVVEVLTGLRGVRGCFASDVRMVINLHEHMLGLARVIKEISSRLCREVDIMLVTHDQNLSIILEDILNYNKKRREDGIKVQ